jgi:hypothetical protein
MDCRQCAENMTAFLDGELRASESAQMRLHLNVCPSCADELRGLKEAAGFVELHRIDLEPRLESWNMVRARLSAPDSSAWFHFFAPNRWRISTVSLVIIVALGIGYLQYERHQRINLENYITKYIHDREAGSRIQPIQWDAAENSPIEIPYADNPFMEIRADSTENPFSSELDLEEE